MDSRDEGENADSDHHDAARRQRVLLAVVVFAVLFAQVLLYPGIPQLVSALDVADAGAFDASKWFLTAEFAAFVLFASIWGALSDARGKRRPFIAVGAGGGALGYLLLAALPSLIEPSLGVVLVLRFLQGALTIGALSLGMAMLMDLPGGHGQNMGAAGIAIGTGVAFGAPVGGQLSAQHPLAPLAAAAFVLGLATAGTLLLDDRVPDSDRDGAREALANLTRTPALLVPATFGFIDRLTAGFFALVGTFYFQTEFGLGPAATGVTLALFFMPFALLQYPFGKLSDRIGRTLPIVGGSIGYGVGVLAVGLAGTLLAAQAAMVAIGVLGAFMAPATMALVTDLAADDQRGAAIGLFNIFGSVGFLVGIAVGGTVADAIGFTPAFVGVGALEIAIALLALPLLLRLSVPTDTTQAVGRGSD